MTRNTTTGWMMWKDGQPYGIPNGWSETKRSLLIGYDLMPLRGLEVTEQVMAEKGKVARETLVEIATEEDHDCYGAVINGQFVPDMLGWSVCSDTAEQTFESTAFYFAKSPGCRYHPKRPIDIMSDEDTYACNEFYWRSSNWHIYHDRRRLSTLERSRQKAIAVFERYRIEIVPIRYRLVEDKEHNGLRSSVLRPDREHTMDDITRENEQSASSLRTEYHER